MSAIVEMVLELDSGTRGQLCGEFAGEWFSGPVTRTTDGFVVFTEAGRRLGRFDTVAAAATALARHCIGARRLRGHTVDVGFLRDWRFDGWGGSRW